MKNTVNEKRITIAQSIFIILMCVAVFQENMYVLALNAILYIGNVLDNLKS